MNNPTRCTSFAIVLKKSKLAKKNHFISPSERKKQNDLKA
jgi:hypothetical protein